MQPWSKLIKFQRLLALTRIAQEIGRHKIGQHLRILQAFELIRQRRRGGPAALNNFQHDAQQVRQLPVLIAASDEMQQMSAQIKRFLLSNLYRHPQVMQTTQEAQAMVRGLFARYVAEPALMPSRAVQAVEAAGAAQHAQAGNSPRRVADYIAGMTDRFATREHARLTGSSAFAAW